MIQIYHNPRCGKSREAVIFLEQSNKPFEIIKYLETPPSTQDLKEVIKKLGIKPIDLVRKKEDVWKPYTGKKMTPDRLIAILCKNPILIERPIVINGEKAVIARFPEKVFEILEV